jgi:hypothetical protein
MHKKDRQETQDQVADAGKNQRNEQDVQSPRRELPKSVRV